MSDKVVKIRVTLTPLRNTPTPKRGTTKFTLRSRRAGWQQLPCPMTNGPRRRHSSGSVVVSTQIFLSLCTTPPSPNRITVIVRMDSRMSSGFELIVWEKSPMIWIWNDFCRQNRNMDILKIEGHMGEEWGKRRVRWGRRLVRTNNVHKCTPLTRMEHASSYLPFTNQTFHTALLNTPMFKTSN